MNLLVCASWFYNIVLVDIGVVPGRSLRQVPLPGLFKFNLNFMWLFMCVLQSHAARDGFKLATWAEDDLDFVIPKLLGF